ncbi:MAG: zinc ribbon domain-containing protein [Bacillota bacterium]|nr:zinc ribbon domain-containing protein [Bacillota bacterium]
MPIYEFVCPQCGHRFEELVVRSYSEDSAACPRCGAPEARRVPSSFGFRSGGTGGSSTAPAGGGCSGCSGRSCSTCR